TLEFGALFGGLAIGLAPAFLVHSRFATVDVTGTFLIALSLYFAFRLLPDREGMEPSHFIRWAVLAGIFAGLSAGTKYGGAIALLPVYAAILLSKCTQKGVLYAASTLAALIAFMIATPAVFLDQAKFKTDFLYEISHT